MPAPQILSPKPARLASFSKTTGRLNFSPKIFFMQTFFHCRLGEEKIIPLCGSKGPGAAMLIPFIFLFLLKSPIIKKRESKKESKSALAGITFAWDISPFLFPKATSVFVPPMSMAMNIMRFTPHVHPVK